LFLDDVYNDGQILKDKIVPATLGDNDSLSNQWIPLIYTTADQSSFSQRYDQPTRENVLQFLSFDEDNENSIAACVTKARENARAIRGVISGVVWEQLNKFYFMDKKIQALESKIQLKNEVVAELLQEHVQLKKELGEP
jgi:uncharacterized alpha-E superfamily protein